MWFALDFLDDWSIIVSMKNTSSQKSRGRKPQSGKPFDDTREALIRKGLELWTEKGFNATGLGELLKTVGVPKGSFYHYFSSKDDFGREVIKAYDAFFSAKLLKHFANDSLKPLARLQAFIEDATQGIQRYEYRRGCLVGNLGQEMASLDEGFREQLSAVFGSWESSVKGLLEKAVDTGELPPNTDCEALAKFFWMGWEGAILRARLERNSQPLEIFSQQFFTLCNTTGED